MAISAADVKKLRDQTGAGMMDCKKALTEAGGDFEKAIEELRKKGQKLSAKRADREAKEGAVIAKISHNKNNGVVVRLSSETDFVSKGEGFVSLAHEFADIALKNLPDTKDDLLALDCGGMTIAAKIEEQTGVIGEKIELTDYAKIETVAPPIKEPNPGINLMTLPAPILAKAELVKEVTKAFPCVSSKSTSYTRHNWRIISSCNALTAKISAIKIGIIPAPIDQITWFLTIVSA